MKAPRCPRCGYAFLTLQREPTQNGVVGRWNGEGWAFPKSVPPINGSAYLCCKNCYVAMKKNKEEDLESFRRSITVLGIRSADATLIVLESGPPSGPVSSAGS